MKTIIAFGVCALALAASAPTPSRAADPPAQRTCFWTRDIQNHTLSGSSVYLRMRNKDVYELQSKGGCGAGHMRDDPLIFNLNPSSGQVCSPIDLNLKIGRPGGGPATPCIVDNIRKLTPAEAAALPKKVSP